MLLNACIHPLNNFDVVKHVCLCMSNMNTRIAHIVPIKTCLALYDFSKKKFQISSYYPHYFEFLIIFFLKLYVLHKCQHVHNKRVLHVTLDISRVLNVRV
jgi:hypothetical protein